MEEAIIEEENEELFDGTLSEFDVVNVRQDLKLIAKEIEKKLQNKQKKNGEIIPTCKTRCLFLNALKHNSP